MADNKTHSWSDYINGSKGSEDRKWHNYALELANKKAEEIPSYSQINSATFSATATKDPAGTTIATGELNLSFTNGNTEVVSLAKKSGLKYSGTESNSVSILSYVKNKTSNAGYIECSGATSLCVDMYFLAFYSQAFNSTAKVTWNYNEPRAIVTVSKSGEGTVTGAGTYHYGNSYTIKATPATGYKFVKWSDGNTNASRTFTVDSSLITAYETSKSYQAVFEKQSYTLTVTAGTGGTVSGGGSYSYGSTATLKATPNTGYKFVKWSDGNTSATRTVTVSGAATYTATFEKLTYTVTWKNADGTTLETDTGVAYGTTPTYNGSTPTKAYDSSNHYTFKAWSPAVGAISGNTTYTATFNSVAHSYTTETSRTPATCTATGSVTKKCSCGATQTTTLAKDPNNHTGGTEVRNATSATCTATGYTGDTYCKGCGVKISSGSTIAKKSHTEVTVSAVAATCTATGLTEGKKCSVCGTVTVAQTTVAKNPNNHTGSQTTLSAVAATCTETGKTEGKKWSCCNAIITAQQTVAALGHSYTSKVTAPTATAGGYTTYTCSRCGHSYKDNYTFLITANSNNNNYGTVSGGGTYNQGATATLTATAKPCYKFVKWNDGNTSATRTVTVSASATYTATFEADPPKILSVTITRSSDLAKVTMSTPVDAGAKYIISVEVT